MAAATLSYSTAGTSLNLVYRTIQGAMYTAYQNQVEEWDLIQDIDENDITISARSMEVPVDLTPAGGAAMIAEGNAEAIMFTPNLNKLTLTWVNLNQRFGVTLTAKYLDQSSKDGMVTRQLRYQAMKAMESIANRVGMQFYGFSTGSVALLAGSGAQLTATTATLTLTSAYGDTTVTDANFIAQLIRGNEQIALQRGATLVPNAIGQTNSSGPTVSGTAVTVIVTFIGNITASASDILIFANSAIDATNSTLALGTDANNWPVGLKDGTETASVHSLSSSTVPLWAAAYTDSTTARYSVILERKARQAIQNKGGGKANLRIISNGVQNDVLDAERAAYRVDDANNINFDGAYKTKGITEFTSRHVPNGHVFLLDKGKALSKFSLTKPPTESAPAWADGDKVQNYNALAFSIDWPWAIVWKRRGCAAAFKGKTEQ